MAKIAGYTVNSSRNDVASPPTIGAAIRFITSAPVPVLTMIGTSAMNVVSTVISFGRMRRAAPSTIASRRSAKSRIRPSAARRLCARVKYKSMITPVSASSPASAISPTQTATLML